MMSVGRVAETSAMTAATAPKPAERVSEEKSTTLASEHTDKFVKSETGFTPAYTKATVTDNRSNQKNDHTADDSKSKASEKTDSAKAASKSVRQMKNEGMKDIVAKLIGGQASGTKATSSIDQLLRSYGLEPLKADSEDFWGAEKTANRILDFAKALAGDDEKAFEKMKNAVEKAFGECEGIWGGKLPSVCYETKDLIAKGFDEWEKEIAAKKAEKETPAAAK
ncbi:MAG: hypothetical protein K2N56_08960 [Oscillospiraceae bacterium]|nr:hypothetical protein [Oscillospiraceae bacterium]